MATNRLEILQGMLTQDPNNSFARYGLAMELVKSGNYSEAVSQFETLLKHDESYAAAYYHGGQAYEKLGDVEAGSKDSVLNSALVPHQYPTGSGAATEFAIDPAKAREAFAGDLSDEQANLIAAVQRPVSELAFSEPTGPPAWKKLPS